MHRDPLGAVGLVVCTLLVVVALGGVAGVDAATGDGYAADDVGSVAGDALVASTEVDADAVTMRATVDETGAAAWRIDYRVRLDTDDREAAFADLEADVAENESAYVERFDDRMSSTAAGAADATGREMAIEDVSVSTTRQNIPEEYGVLRYEFTWTGFAVVDDGRILAGDALAGTFLAEDHRLTLAWPESYELDAVRPDPAETQSDRVVWVGPTEFADDEPYLAVGQPSAFGGSGLWIAALLSLLVVGGAAYWRRQRVLALIGADADAPADGTAGSDAADPAGHGEDGVSPGADGTGADGTGAGGTGAGAAGGDGTDEEPPEELLSNEERVLRLIERRGGRMKQQEVVQELGWTDARTSQVVSGLREEGELESFRIGRENVLRLPEADEIAPDTGDDGRGADEQ